MDRKSERLPSNSLQGGPALSIYYVYFLGLVGLK